MPHPFHILDVFTDRPLAGNPLAVVLEADGLDTDRCQAIAREFNLSETVFVSAPRDPINTARLRIFTPTRELPFAGHPTVGTAVLLGQLRAPEILARQDLAVVLEEPIGAVDCIVRRVKGTTLASFTLPRLPLRSECQHEAADVAAALSLPTDRIGFDQHRPSVFSAGNPFVFVPLADRASVTAAAPNLQRWTTAFPAPGPSAAFVYCRETTTSDAQFHARMFATDLGIGEDPATGSAVAAFAGVVMAFEKMDDGDHTLRIEQGFAMGRPSLITLGLDVLDGRLVSASVGGSAVRVAQGTLL